MLVPAYLKRKNYTFHVNPDNYREIIVEVDYERSWSDLLELEGLIWPCMFEYIKYDKEKLYSGTLMFTY